MQEMIKFEKKITEWWEAHIPLIIGCTIFGMMVYFMMMALGLTNSLDGIWHTSYYIGGVFEISLGRGFLRYFDKMHFGVVSVALNSVLSLLIASVAISLLIDLLAVKNKIYKILIAALVISNPVMCVTLSYSYATVGYNLAYLFSVVSVYAVYTFYKEKWYLGCAMGAVFLTISMGCYQAYAGVFSFLLLGVLVRMILDKEKWKHIGMFLVSGIVTILLGGGLYFLFVQFMLKYAHVELISYGGANEVSLVNILKNLPVSFLDCYREFYNYFMVEKMYVNLPLIEWILFALGFIFLCALLYQVIVLLRYHWMYALGLVICVSLLPIACNSEILVVVSHNVGIVMAMGMVLAPVYGILLVQGRGSWTFFMRRMLAVILCLLCWYQTFMVVNDQVALKEGRIATTELTGNVIHELTTQGYLSGQQSFAFVGLPAENDLFVHQGAYERANKYARFGSWFTGAGDHSSWGGVLRDCCGTNISLCKTSEYEDLIRLQEVADMPEFPAEGSIQEIDGVVVVKISEVY